MGLAALACSVSSSGATSTPRPTLSSDDVQTIVVQTANAALTQTQLVITPSNTPSKTPTSTQTRIPSATPSATLPIPRLVRSPTNTLTLFEIYTANAEKATPEPKGKERSTPVPTTYKMWRCEGISKSPRNHEVMEPYARFAAYWEIKNIGGMTWGYNDVDVVYHSGEHMEINRRIIDLPRSVPPGDSITIKITMMAPAKPGDYHTIWSLKVGNREFCQMILYISVQK